MMWLLVPETEGQEIEEKGARQQSKKKATLLGSQIGERKELEGL